jgi:hypothetical protein
VGKGADDAFLACKAINNDGIADQKGVNAGFNEIRHV